MSVAEMKKNVLAKVETLSETQLNELNKFIDQINDNVSTKSDFMKHAEKIFEERKDVLQKLAQ